MPATMTSAELQKALKDFLARRHPDYDCMLPHWNFCESTYKGGREWFSAPDHDSGNIFRYIKEGEKEYKDRVKRAYRFNHTREVTDLVQKYIFKSTITRTQDAPAECQEFWKKANFAGLDINQFMKLVSTQTSILGRIWVMTDTTKTAHVLSLADQKATGARVYAEIFKPQDVLDVGFDDVGETAWILLREYARDDIDPIFSSGACYERYRLWTRYDWKLFEIQESTSGRKKVREVVLVDTDVNPLGEVPGFPVDHVIGDNKYSAPSLIGDIAYLDRAIANYLSNLDAIIQDQTFSQLVIPAQGLTAGTDEYNQLVEMGTKRMFVYDGEGGVAPEFISPDPRQANVIIVVINKIINEIYHTIGMAGERTKQDNAVGIDNSSGVAKAYDFERMNSLLTSKADSLENCENKLNRLVMLWNGKAEPKDELVKYPDTFDVRSLFDEFTIADRLAVVEAPDLVRREQMKQVIDKLFPRLVADLKKQMESELQDWPPPLDLVVTDTVGGAAQPAKFPSVASKTRAAKATATAQKRQGQVTKQTD